MANENELLNDVAEISEDSFDFDELDEKLERQLAEKLSDLEFLEEEKEKIGNPDSLGKTVMDEVLQQLGNQIGLDKTNETLIQEYDRKHPEKYKEIADSIMKDQRYKDANKAMKEQQQSGNLKDAYTGKELKQNDQANLDHVVPRKELYENQRRKQANIDTADLANKSENLKPTNESLNKSKGAKSNQEYVNKRSEREQQLKQQSERAKKKIDESNMSEADKRLQKERIDKRLNDKLNADDDLMMKADKTARKAINKDIRKGAAKQIGKKAGTDALKRMIASSLFLLLKEVINGLIRFFKEKSKSFKTFLSEMKKSIHSFISDLMNVLNTGVSTLVGTIVSEIFGPIVSAFRKLASLIKQAVDSIIDAITYLKDKKNKDKPFSIKVAQVGKIVVGSLVGGGAILLGEIIEFGLMTIPIFAVEIPLLGSLSNIIGMFMGALVSGVIGAIIIHRIDKLIAKQQKAELTTQKVHKRNEILNTQQQIVDINAAKLDKTKSEFNVTITERHKEAAELMKDLVEKTSSRDNEIILSDNDADLTEINEILDNITE